MEMEDSRKKHVVAAPELPHSLHDFTSILAVACDNLNYKIILTQSRWLPDNELINNRSDSLIWILFSLGMLFKNKSDGHIDRQRPAGNSDSRKLTA